MIDNVAYVGVKMLEMPGSGQYSITIPGASKYDHIVVTISADDVSNATIKMLSANFKENIFVTATGRSSSTRAISYNPVTRSGDTITSPLNYSFSTLVPYKVAMWN